VAFFIDLVGSFLIIGYVVARMSGSATSSSFSLTGWYLILTEFLAYLYFMIFDRYFGGTLGKRLFKLK